MDDLLYRVVAGGLIIFGIILPWYVRFLGREFGKGLELFINDYLDRQYKQALNFNAKKEKTDG